MTEEQLKATQYLAATDYLAFRKAGIQPTIQLDLKSILFWAGLCGDTGGPKGLQCEAAHASILKK